MLQRFSDLGSGFNIASHDLEIRGAGGLCSEHVKQGTIAAVGFEMYTRMLEEAVASCEVSRLSDRSIPTSPAICSPTFPGNICPTPASDSTSIASWASGRRRTGGRCCSPSCPIATAAFPTRSSAWAI